MMNYDLRRRASKVIRPNLQVLLVIALITALPGLMINVIVARTGSDLTTYLFAQGIDATSTVEQLMEGVSRFYAERAWVAPVLSLAGALIIPVLTLGFNQAMLTLLRGGTATVTDVFSRMSIAIRATLLTLWITVKMLLWMLPGFALIVASVFLGYDGPAALLALVGIGLLVALPTVAYYRYDLAPIFLADEPETGVLACVRKSKAAMKGRKMQLFTLTLPYNIGRGLAVGLGVEILGYVLGNLVSMTIQLILSVYITGACCAFYEAYARPEGGRAHAFQADPYHDEMQD